MYICETCGHEDEVDTPHMYIDCPECTTTVGMKKVTAYQSVNIKKFGSGDNPMSTVYAQNYYRPRSGRI